MTDDIADDSDESSWSFEEGPLSVSGSSSEDPERSDTDRQSSDGRLDDINWFYVLYKCPEEFYEGEHDPFAERGVYPSGEVMDVFLDPEEIEASKERLENLSPSERFGETMEDAPYHFYIHAKRVE